MNLQVPSDLCNKLMGVAVCAVFVLRQQHPLHQLYLLWCYLKANGYRACEGLYFHFTETFGKIESYHHLQGYFPYKSFDRPLKENLSQTNVDGFSQIGIEFITQGPGLEVTKCGGRLIFEQDIENLN